MQLNDPNSRRANAEAECVSKLGDRPSNNLVYELIYELDVHSIELKMQSEELRRSHIELEKSRDRYMELYEFAPVGYLTLTHEAFIAQANLTAAALFGVERSKLLKHRFSALVAAQDSDTWHLFFSAVKKHQKNRNTELMLKRSNGTEFFVQLNGCALMAADQEPALRIALIDITDRKLAEQSLKESESFLSAMFNAAPDAMLISDAQGIITMANQQAERLLGYSTNELTGLSINALLAERFSTEPTALRPQLTATNTPLTLIVNAVRKNGCELEVEVSLSPIQTNRGLIYAYALRGNPRT